MSLALKSLQTEMRSSFVEINERIDRVLLKLDAHVKETDFRFCQIDQRFDEMEKRFDDKFKQLTSDIIGALFPYFDNLEKIVNNHEERITVLEKAH